MSNNVHISGDPDNDDDEEYECPGKDDCTEDDCPELHTYYVEVTRTVKFKVTAHDEDEANELASEVDLDPSVPNSPYIEDLDTGDSEVEIEDEREVWERQKEMRRMLAEIETEEGL